MLVRYFRRLLCKANTLVLNSSSRLVYDKITANTEKYLFFLISSNSVPEHQLREEKGKLLFKDADHVLLLPPRPKSRSENQQEPAEKKNPR